MKKAMAVLWCALAFLPLLAQEEIKVSTFGFDPDDSTRFLQAALDSGARRVIVDQTGRPWLTGPLHLRRSLELVIAAGVRLEALPGGYPGLRDAMLTAAGISNLIIRGEEGAELVMRKSDYQDAARYPKSEWRHCLNLLSCTDVSIRDLKLSSSGGDGIYLGVLPGHAQNYCKDILIERVVCDDHHRQGISVIGIDGLILRDSVFSNTGGTAPMAGIDFEPNGYTEPVRRVLVENCRFDNNQGGGIMLAFTPRDPVSMTIRNCVVSGPSRGIVFYKLRDRASSGHVAFENIRIEGVSRDALFIRNHQVDDYYTFSFKGLEIVSAADASAGNSPIAFIVDKPWADRFGGGDFANVTIRGYQNSPPVVLKKWSERGAALRQVTGGVDFNGTRHELSELLQGADFDLPAYQMGSVDLAALQAPQGERILRPSPKLRGRFDLLFWGEAGQTSSFTLDFQNMGRKYQVNTLQLRGPGGVAVDLGTLDRGEKKTLNVVFPRTGAYLLPLDVQTNCLVFTPGEHARWAVKSADGGSGMTNLFRIGRRYQIFFAVPAGQAAVQLEVGGDPGEPMHVEVRDASGAVVAAKANFDAPTVFRVERTGRQAEVWSCTVTEATEDVNIRLHAPLLPIWADSPGNLPR